MARKSVSDVQEELLGLYDAWFDNIPPHGESAFLRQILSDDWVYVNYDGETRGKDDYLAYIQPVPRSHSPRRVERDMQVRLYGDVVIVHGRYFAPGVGKAGETLLFTGGWTEQGGAWKCLFHHSTILKES